MTRCRTLVATLIAAAVPAFVATPAQARALTLGDRSLHVGMQGRDVRVLQDFLTRVGVRTYVDGNYGPFTSSRVKVWERRSSIPVDGRVSKRDAATLRGQVTQGARVLDTTPAQPAPAAAPAPAASAPAGATATLGADGHAVAPASAPDVVKNVIAAANRIVGKPYRYGGGHGQWEDSGYDCSGSESYALRGGGLITRPMNSTEYMSWGEPGYGTWITSFANPGHAYLVVAGLRFDTGWNNAGKGPRWSTQMRPADGYTVRHPAGL